MENKTINLEKVDEGTNTFKAYKLVLSQGATGWNMSGFNGRIGKPLKEQPKIVEGTYESALAAFESTLKSKLKDKYVVVGDAGVQMVAQAGLKQAADEVDQDLVAALPTAISEEEFCKLDPNDFLLQEKHDGENRPIRVDGDRLSCANREGIPSDLPQEVKEELVELSNVLGPLRLDSEDMGPSGIVIFDIIDGLGSSRDMPFEQRNECLAALRDEIERRGLVFLKVDVAMPLVLALENGLISDMRDALAEGVVCKDADAPYTPGRINAMKSATSFKLKFYEDATFRVAPARKEGVRSVGLETYNDSTGEWQPAGNVTIPASEAAVPAAGSFVDVTYLYAGTNGVPYQPIFKKVRTDITVTPEDCAISKLKIKRPRPEAPEKSSTSDFGM